MLNNIKILTFAKGNFIESQNLLKKHLFNLGLNNQINLTEKDLDSNFLEEFKEILNFKKGYGYCIWKPYLILKELKKLNKEEILLYIDSTDLPLKPFFELIINNFKEEEYLLLNRGYNNGQWTKRDTFVLMDCDSPTYYNQVQLEAGIIGLKMTEFNLKLVQEWFNFCKNKNIITELPNICGLPNINNFIEHRYDQSILTNISIKYNLKSNLLSEEYIKYNYNQPKIY